MISDAELLKLVMQRYPEQPTPFIIEQFTVLKAGLIQANNKLAAMDMEEPVCEQVIIEEPMPEAAEAAPSAAPKKKFTKRSLVVRPEEAIGDDVVQCCLCGRGFQNLTAKHLLSHGISVDEYKKLCGYVPEQKLICKNLLEKLQEHVRMLGWGGRKEGWTFRRREWYCTCTGRSLAGCPFGLCAVRCP